MRRVRLVLRNRFTGKQNRFSVLLEALLRAAFVTIWPIFTTVVGPIFVTAVRASFRPALRLRLSAFFLACFHRLFTLAAIARCLVGCAAIGKAVTPASSTAAASAPLARAFPLLRGAIFCWRTLCGLLLCVVLFVADRNGRHDFLRLNRPMLSLSAANLDDRGVAGTGDGFANGIGVLVFFHQEVGNVEKRVALKANVYKSGLHARQNARHASFVDGAGQCVFVFSFEIYF